MKRCRETEPALISVIFFICALPELGEIPLVEKQQQCKNCQSIMFDEEGLDPHGIGNLPSQSQNPDNFRVRRRVECTKSLFQA